MVDAAERLQVLLRQENNIYKTCDYLTRMQQEAKTLATATGAYLSREDGQSPPSSKKRKSQSNEDGSCHFGNNSSTHGDLDTGDMDESSASSSQINKHWRQKICEWAYQVVDHFDLNREVVSIAMNHLDRYLGVYPAPVDKNLFQLLAMTCLYLSIKLNEYKHLIIQDSKSTMDTILQLSRGFFTLQEMERMECDILQRLQWHVHPPTPQVFVKHFLCFMNLEEREVHDLAHFMVELSVMDYFFVSYKPSEVSVAALLNAMERLYPHAVDQLNFHTQSQFFDVNPQNVKACQERLALIHAQANDQAMTDGSENTPTKGAGAHDAHRTTSPVSVMAPPEPTNVHHYAAHAEGMETEYSDDDEDL